MHNNNDYTFININVFVCYLGLLLASIVQAVWREWNSIIWRAAQVTWQPWARGGQCFGDQPPWTEAKYIRLLSASLTQPQPGSQHPYLKFEFVISIRKHSQVRRSYICTNTIS